MRTRRRLAAAAAVLLGLTTTACGPFSDDGPAAAPSQPASSSAARSLLADFDLSGLDAVQIVDRLDRLGGSDRPTDLFASVRPSELLLSTKKAEGGSGTEFTLPIPDDRFYLSVAPYVENTHECFHHSLTTCKGELGGKQVTVQIVDETNDEVLVDGPATVFENGFVGFWLPRDIEGSIRVSHDGKQAETDFATGEEDPTCLTTMKLA